MLILEPFFVSISYKFFFKQFPISNDETPISMKHGLHAHLSICN